MARSCVFTRNRRRQARDESEGATILRLCFSDMFRVG